MKRICTLGGCERNTENLRDISSAYGVVLKRLPTVVSAAQFLQVLICLTDCLLTGCG